MASTQSPVRPNLQSGVVQAVVGKREDSGTEDQGSKARVAVAAQQWRQMAAAVEEECKEEMKAKQRVTRGVTDTNRKTKKQRQERRKHLC